MVMETSSSRSPKRYLYPSSVDAIGFVSRTKYRQFVKDRGYDSDDASDITSNLNTSPGSGLDKQETLKKRGLSNSRSLRSIGENNDALI